MNELSRQAYLDAMGVDVYFPRLLLPAAPVPKLCEAFSVAALTSLEVNPLQNPRANTQVASVNDPVKANQSHITAMQALLGDDSEATFRRHSDQIPKSLAGIKNKTNLPRFSLSVTRIGAFVIIDDAAPENSPALKQLQNNFFLALGLVAELQRHYFKWPIVESSHLDRSELAAKQTLRVFVQNQLSSAPSEALLLLGQTARSFLLDDATVMGEWLPNPFADVPVLCAPSLISAFESAQLKAELWRAVKPLQLKLTQ